jgi:hypothetical protein
VGEDPGDGTSLMLSRTARHRVRSRNSQSKVGEAKQALPEIERAVLQPVLNNSPPVHRWHESRDGRDAQGASQWP